MATILAQCKDEKCATIFLQPFPATVKGQGTVTLIINNISEKEGAAASKHEKTPPILKQNIQIACPKCGGAARWPDGTYAVDSKDNGNGKLARLVDGPEKTKHLVKQVEHLIQLLEKGNPTKEAVISAVAQVSPALAEITRKTANTTNYKEWAVLIISLLGLLISIQQGYFKKEESQDIKQEYLEHLLKENQELKKTSGGSNIPVKAEIKSQPNGPCPCGSNKKFKKCHGLTQPR